MTDDLHTYIEPELEARITALVLGEVSAFDLEELEQIIASKPELQILRRRIEMMHGLLGDTMKPEKDEAWKLSGERRAKLLRTFSQNPDSLGAESGVSRVVRQAQWRAGISIAACLVVCLVIFSLMTPVVLRQGVKEHFTAEIVSYQAASDGGPPSEYDRYVKSEGGGEAPADEVPLVGDLPVVGSLFGRAATPPAKGQKEIRLSGNLGVDTDSDGLVVQKREMTRGVERKPSAPSSSMATVIAGNMTSQLAVPEPEIMVPDSSVEFGDGDDFGAGWGAGAVAEAAVEGGVGSPEDHEKLADLEDDPFGGGGGGDDAFDGDPFAAAPEEDLDERFAYKNKAPKLTKPSAVRRTETAVDARGRISRLNEPSVEGVRELKYLSEYEPPELPNTVDSGGETDPVNVTPAGKTAFESRSMELAELMLEEESLASRGFAEGKKLRMNVDGRAVTSLRSGDYAVTRDSIDEILNAPVVKGKSEKGGSGKDIQGRYSGYLNLGQYDKAEKQMEQVLRADPYNKEARRVLEKIASVKSDYYRAAYDSTRAELLKDVDQAWEIEVPGQVGAELSADKKAASGKITSKPRNGLEKKDQTMIEDQKAKPLPVDKAALPEEVSTAAQPFSTFSLNVSDVSFKLAKVALLEKGQWPEASKVRTEEFVNAFDYGDPSPRRGEPVACAIEQSAHPFLQQRNLLRIGMKTATLGRSAPLRLTVLLDNSGSMDREDREASVLAAIRLLADQLGPDDQVTLIGFALQPRLLADRIPGDQAQKLVQIVANTPSEGGTNLEEALRLARQLAKRQQQKGAQDRVVLITDGVANLGNTVPDQLALEIEKMRQEGIAFDACGVGAEDLNDEILEALTRKGDGRYYFLNRPEDADSGFARQLAGALSPAAKNVKVQVKFNPERVSQYRLLGFEKHRLKKEDFRNDKVDAAEMASEEAGNAVYQVKVDPDGEGEIGEVFVRFFDVNSGRMVERSWTLIYEPQAEAFEQSSPSMQLAGTAAMLGEKLHGTDGGSVRMGMLSGTFGQLRAHYQADSKVQDLIRMCEKLK